jgi:iron complex outermembrane receptor protein
VTFERSSVIRDSNFSAMSNHLLNQQYFLFHPFPGRTYVPASKYTF